jgi:hypothetical protein
MKISLLMMIIMTIIIGCGASTTKLYTGDESFFHTSAIVMALAWNGAYFSYIENIIYRAYAKNTRRYHENH